MNPPAGRGYLKMCDRAGPVRVIETKIRFRQRKALP